MNIPERPKMREKTLKIGYWGDGWIHTAWDGSIWEIADWEAGLILPRSATEEERANRLEYLQNKYPGYKSGPKKTK